MSTKSNLSKSDVKEKVLWVNRCAKVTKGGRKFGFSALIAVGNGKNKVGFGFAKASELSDAIRKGGEAARKNMVTVKMENDTIPNEVRVKKDGVTLLLKPAPSGYGLVAGSAARAILELAGVKNAIVKIIRGKAILNQVYALFEAFSSFKTKEERHQERGISC